MFVRVRYVRQVLRNRRRPPPQDLNGYICPPKQLSQRRPRRRRCQIRVSPRPLPMAQGLKTCTQIGQRPFLQDRRPAMGPISPLNTLCAALTPGRARCPILSVRHRPRASRACTCHAATQQRPGALAAAQMAALTQQARAQGAVEPSLGPPHCPIRVAPGGLRCCCGDLECSALEQRAFFRTATDVAFGRFN